MTNYQNIKLESLQIKCEEVSSPIGLPIAMLFYCFRDLEEIFDIYFDRTVGDMGEEVSAVFKWAEISRDGFFGLREQLDSPTPGIQVYINEYSENPRIDMEKILSLLSLDTNSVQWINPDLSERHTE